ncbi:DUF4230 domain-containing protein [Akkermansiaceae bacterium]|nr:DUF4230 domain-containing protein [Akkermansiaceae bacterium]
MIKHFISLSIGIGLTLLALKMFPFLPPLWNKSSTAQEGAQAYIIHDTAKKIMEQATAEKKLRVAYVYETTWFGSTKKITIKGNFIAKAGYKIDDIRLKNGEILLDSPSLLSCELIFFEIHEDSGTWNRITTEDREKAVNALCNAARAKALNDDLIQTTINGAKEILNSPKSQSIEEPN